MWMYIVDAAYPSLLLFSTSAFTSFRFLVPYCAAFMNEVATAIGKSFWQITNIFNLAGFFKNCPEILLRLDQKIFKNAVPVQVTFHRGFLLSLHCNICDKTDLYCCFFSGRLTSLPQQSHPSAFCLANSSIRGTSPHS